MFTVEVTQTLEPLEPDCTIQPIREWNSRHFYVTPICACSWHIVQVWNIGINRGIRILLYVHVHFSLLIAPYTCTVHIQCVHTFSHTQCNDIHVGVYFNFFFFFAKSKIHPFTSLGTRLSYQYSVGSPIKRMAKNNDFRLTWIIEVLWEIHHASKFCQVVLRFWKSL